MDDLEKLYSPSKWSKRLPPETICEKHVEFITKESDEVRNNLKCELDNSYGLGEREKYDLYGTDLPDDAPIFIHIHGGYYQEQVLTHKNNSFIAKNLHKNGVKSIFIGYELCPNVTLEQLLENVGIAMKKCLHYAKNCKSKGIYLSGHSAGAHAVAYFFLDFIRTVSKEDQKLFKAAFLLCGVYDLVPITKMSANELLQLDEEIAKELSPQFQELTSGEGDTIFYVVAAEDDSPAFVKQSNDFCEYLKTLGIKSEYKLIKGVDHFDAIEKLVDETYELTKFIIEIISK